MRGALALCVALRAAGCRDVVVPQGNAGQAALAPGVRVLAASCLSEVNASLACTADTCFDAPTECANEIDTAEQCLASGGDCMEVCDAAVALGCHVNGTGITCSQTCSQSVLQGCAQSVMVFLNCAHDAAEEAGGCTTEFEAQTGFCPDEFAAARDMCTM